MPKHFQKPMGKEELITDSLEYLKVKLESWDYNLLKAGLMKMSLNQLGILHHQLWTLNKKEE